MSMVETPVTDSSAITSYGYDESTGDFGVTWRGGRRTVYPNVPQTLFNSFVAARSKGQFLNRYIVDKFKPR